MKRLLLLAAILVAALTTARAAQAPPHNISAANLSVVQNNNANTEASVTVSATLSINDLRVRPGSNRGDYNVQIGDTGTNDLADGFILTAISQNSRYNFDEQSEPFYGASAFDGNANGFWVVAQDVTDARAEYNVDCAVAYFRYTNWLSGWARNSTGANGGTNNLFTGSPGLLLGTHFMGISGGRSRVDLRSLGIYSTNSFPTNTGVLLVNHAKNEGNFALSVANPDGTWEIYVKDNFGSATNPNSLEADPAAFVYIPNTNTTVVSGKFALDPTGTNAVIQIHSGPTPAFSITNFATGRYRLTIPGASPASGVLIVSAEGGYPANFDNIVTYEADGNGWIIESRDTGIYPPVLEACTNEPIASFVFIPAATPGLTVTPGSTLVTSEFGIAANFSVVLDLAPTHDVSIAVSSSTPAEGQVSLNNLVFTPANWNIPQTVTVTGQDDALTDGPVSFRIVLAPAVSEDLAYNGLDPADVPVINADDEQAGISVTPTSGLVTTEAGGTATFSVFLNRQPAADVVIGLSSGNLAEGTVAPASLTFTPADWNTPKTVTVTGVDDARQDNDIAYTIVTAPATSTDPAYQGLNPADVSVVNLNNDTAGYVWNYNLPLQVVEGTSITYSLALGTQPDSNVVINITSGNTNAGRISPASLTFTPTDWSTPKIITLAGVDNLVPNANVNFNINHQPVSTDPIYSQLASVIAVPALAVDNEAKLVLPSGDCFYGLGMPPIGIDGQASLEDVDAVSYNNGSLSVAFTTGNDLANDRLEIRPDGKIGVHGAEVTYEGVVIGAFTGGTGGAPLAVTFNANTTVAGAQQLLRSITFRTATNGASLAIRSLVVTLNDGLGVTVTATKQLRVGALRLTQYQEGGDYGYGEYHGAADIALSEVGSDTPWTEGRTPAPVEGLLIDWPDGGTPNESQVLLRFDDFTGTNHWQVPSNAVIVSAELLIRVNNTGDGGKFHRMLIPWNATNDTWNSLVGGVQADDVEARSSYESQMGVEDGSGASGTGIVSIGVTPDVQAWVNGQTNFGWVMKGWPLMTDGTGFSPSEVPVVGDRPRLRVLWLEPGYSLASFRQGVNGYAGAFDTNLRQATNNAAYGAEEILWSDANDAGNTNNTQFLLRFENIIGNEAGRVPPNARILAAFLDLSSVGPDAMGDGGRFYAMLQPWSDATSTWASWVDGIQPDGVEAATNATVVAGSSALDPDVQGTVNSFEVTRDVQAWANGERANHGWVVLPWPNGSNGWGVRSSEYVSLVEPNEPERDRPRLRVFYTANTGVAAASIKKLVVSSSHLQIPFTGTTSKTYTVLRAAQITGPWTSIGTATVDSGGNASYTDEAPLSSGAFYRVVYP